MITSFPPIISEKPLVLILGTVPSIKSLEKRQFYGHPQNAFWRIMFRLFDEAHSDSYDDRINLILSHNLALWDVLKSCEREGSLDSSIKNPVPNDLMGVYNAHPTIRYVVLNGGGAYNFYRKLIRPSLPVPAIKMPSTSPANARLTFEDKLESWMEILEFL